VKEVYLCDAVRTAHGSFCGALKDYPSSALGSITIQALKKNCRFPTRLVKGVFMGQVLTAGEGQNPARHAALDAGLGIECEAETFNKVCSSSLAALRHAVNMIRLGEAHAMIAGGMENMSRAPYLARRTAKRLGDETVSSLYIKSGDEASQRVAYDSMIHDGLTEPSVAERPHMGVIAEMCARDNLITREEQEDFAYESFARAHASEALHAMMIEPILRKASPSFMYDEGIREPNRGAMLKLGPAFSPGGTITAATSSQIADGASALLLADAHAIKHSKADCLAYVRDCAVFSQDPSWYTTAPVGAIEKLLAKNKLTIADIDLFEINEAFAVIPLYAMHTLGIPHEKVNVWGGSIAIGHPLGASGTRIVGQLALQLRDLNKRRGIAVACNGGGEAVAVLLEAVE